MAETRKKTLSGLINKTIIKKIRQPYDNDLHAAASESNNAWAAMQEIDQLFSLQFITPLLKGLKKNKNLSPKKLAKISRFLATRWDLICNTELSYLSAHQYPLNQFCMQLAETIAPLVKKSPFDVLMPSLEIKDYDIVGDSLDDYDFHKPWKYVLSSDKKALIDVATCLLFTKSNLTFKHLYTSKGKQVVLTKEEATRVACHSDASSDLFDLMKLAYKSKYDDGTIGSRLDQLTLFLKSGGVHGQFDGSEYDAGKDAFVAISEFDDYLKSLTTDEKKDLLSRSYKDRIKNRGIQFANGEDIDRTPAAVNTTTHFRNSSENVTLGEIWNRLMRQHVFDQAELLREKKLLDQSSDKNKKLEKKIKTFQDGFDTEHTHVRYCVDVASNEIESISKAPQNQDLYKKKPTNSSSSSVELYSVAEKKLDDAMRAFDGAMEKDDYKVAYSYPRQTTIEHFCKNIIAFLKLNDIDKEEKNIFLQNIGFDLIKKLVSHVDDSIFVSILEAMTYAPTFLQENFNEMLDFLAINIKKCSPSAYSSLFAKIIKPIIDVQKFKLPSDIFNILYKTIPSTHHLVFLRLLDLRTVLQIETLPIKEVLLSIEPFKKISFIVYDALFTTVHSHFQYAFAKTHPPAPIPAKVTPLSLFQSKPKEPHDVKAAALLNRIVRGDEIPATKLKKYKDELEGKGDIAALYAEWKSVNFSR